MAKKVFVLYVGGTIGMRASPRGYVPTNGFEERATALLSRMPSQDLPELRFREYPMPMDSANIRPADWLNIASDIAEAERTFDGFVVLHGTDTLAYTGSALSFLLGGLNKPVVLTGSMIPTSEPRSDAQRNLMNAVKTATCERLNQVCILVGRNLLRANRATKCHSRGLTPFGSPNYPPLGIATNTVTLDDHHLTCGASPQTNWELPKSMATVVVVQPLFPGIGADDLAPLLHRRVDGIILQCYGQGTGPTNDRALFKCLRKLVLRGVVIVAVTQCLEGGVDLGVYRAGTSLRNIGIIDGRDMTLEAAFAKVHWLLAQGQTSESLRRWIDQDLRGELTTI